MLIKDHFSLWTIGTLALDKMTYFPKGGIPGNSLLIIIKMLSGRIWTGFACIFRTVVRKAARAWRTESTWFVSKTPAVRQSPATQQRHTPRQASLHPFSLAKKKGKLKSPKLGRTPLRPARIHCASACCRNRLIVLWPFPVWLKKEWEEKKEKRKGKKIYKENKRVVFFVHSCHWATGRLNREWTQWERMCSNFPIKEHWKRPHAEWLADARELDSLIKCNVVGRLPAFTNFTSPATTASLCRVG